VEDEKDGSDEEEQGLGNLKDTRRVGVRLIHGP
jgi:hypothetical protein